MKYGRGDQAVVEEPAGAGGEGSEAEEGEGEEGEGVQVADRQQVGWARGRGAE
jgi:hypothetical protein